MSDGAAPSNPKRRGWLIIAVAVVALFLAHFPIVHYFFGPLHGDASSPAVDTTRSSQ